MDRVCATWADATATLVSRERCASQNVALVVKMSAMDEDRVSLVLASVNQATRVMTAEF